MTERVDMLRKATVEADKAKLEQVTSAQLSYGHSGGRVETKDQFINGVMTRKAMVTTVVPGADAVSSNVKPSSSTSRGIRESNGRSVHVESFEQRSPASCPGRLTPQVARRLGR